MIAKFQGRSLKIQHRSSFDLNLKICIHGWEDKEERDNINNTNSSHTWPERILRSKHIYNDYIFEISWFHEPVPLIKINCRVRYLFDFDLKIRSGQVWAPPQCSAYFIRFISPDQTFMPMYLQKLAIQIQFVSAVQVRDPQETLKLSFQTGSYNFLQTFEGQNIFLLKKVAQFLGDFV